MPTNPWEMDWSQPAAARSGGALEAVPLPEKPKTPAAQTPAQAQKDVLETEKLRRELAKTPEGDPALAQAIKGLGIDELLVNVGRARKQIKTGFATGVLGSLAGHFPGTPRKDFLGSLEGIKGAAILEKLQALRDQSKTGASGMGSLTEQEGERLANSIASLSPDMSADELNKSLDIMERHAKALQAVGAGKNPEDPAVQKEFGILPLPDAEQPKAEDPPLAPSGGQTRSVIDPKRKAIADRVGALIAKGADRKIIMGFAVGADPRLRDDEKFRTTVDEALKYRSGPEWPRWQKLNGNKPYPLDPESYSYEVPLSAAEQIGNSAAQSAPGALMMNAADAVSAGNLDAVGGEDATRALAVANAQHPGASLAGQVAGGVTAALGGEAALARLPGLAPGLARTAIADTLYGATAGATGAPEGEKVTGGAEGALAAFLGSMGGNLVGRGVGSVVRGVTDPSVSAVAREIPGGLTIGQAVSKSGRVGAGVKKVEDTLTSIPIVGDAINARRLEGLQKMNAKAFDRGLEPVGGKVGGKFGEEAVQDAQEQVSAAFERALAGKSADLDMGFVKDAEKGKMAIDALPDRVRGEVNNSVDTTINNYFDDGGRISGENLQAALRELDAIKRGYANDPLGHRIGQAVDKISDSVENLFRRQAPDVMPQYDAAKKAFRRVSTLEDAVLRGKNTNGVFTPAQLGMADRANATRYGGKHAAAAGKGEFHDFQRNMQEVLPSKVPDSGTAGRFIVPAALVGAGAAGGAEGGDVSTGLTLGGLLALAYTRAGQKALTASVLRRGNAVRSVGTGIRRSSKVIGSGVGTQAALETSRDQ